MQKLLSILLMISLLFTVTACGSSQAAYVPSAPTEEYAAKNAAAPAETSDASAVTAPDAVPSTDALKQTDSLYSSTYENLHEKITAAESADQYWLEIVYNANATQAHMNTAAQERYLLWDGLLNEIWTALKEILDKETMQQLTSQELAWIEEKEQASLDDAAQYEGGSLYPTVYYGTAAKLTKERVYELLDLLSSDAEVPSTADSDMLETYRTILTNILQGQTFPNGIEFGYQDVHDLSENKFAVYDIDADGEDELIVAYITTYTAGMSEIIYAYDSASGTVREEFLVYPFVTFYENGTIEAPWSHNQGYGGRFWPYTLYQYSPDSDTYIEVGMVDGWDKSLAVAGRDGDPFPDDIDINGDGLVYYIMTEGVYELNTPVDLDALERWRNSHIQGAMTVSVPYQALTEENIAKLK